MICLSMTIFLSSLFHVFRHYCKRTIRYFGDFCNPMWPRWFSTGDEKWELCTFGKKAFVGRRRRTAAQVHETRLLLNCKLQQPLSCFAILSSSHNKTLFSEEKSTRHVWPLLKCNNHCICEYLSNFRRDLAFALIMCQKFHKSIPTFQAFWGENINALKSP